MNVYLNLASLILGLGAWLLPCIALIKRKPAYGLMYASFGMCIASICCQFIQAKGLLQNDLSALYDTIDAVMLAVIVLAIVTLVLNAYLLIKERDK